MRLPNHPGGAFVYIVMHAMRRDRSRPVLKRDQSPRKKLSF